MYSIQQCLFGKNRGACLVYHLSSLPVANGLTKPLYKFTNQWDKDTSMYTCVCMYACVCRHNAYAYPYGPYAQQKDVRIHFIYT